MSIKLGESDITAIKLGEAEVESVYLGDELVFSSAAPFSFDITDLKWATVGASHTFTNVNFGAEPGPGETRYIAVLVASVQDSIRSITNFSIAGVSVFSNPIVLTSSTRVPCGAWVLELPTGTSGNVSISWTADTSTAGIVVARIINPGNPMGFDAVTATHSGGTVDLSLNIPDGGAAMAAINSRNAGTTTWTGLTELVDVDVLTDDYFSAAAGGEQGTPHAILAENSDNTPADLAGLAVSWGP